MNTLSKHVHNWIIPMPEGEVSIGKCSCGAEKEFDNWLDVNDRSWNRAMPGGPDRGKKKPWTRPEGDVSRFAPFPGTGGALIGKPQ